MERYQKISSFVYNCANCPTRCDGVSKKEYFFENDSKFSEYFEEQLINYINRNTEFRASKTIEKGFPDLLIEHQCKQKFYIEVKVQQRTFMSVERILPESCLKPSETVALNLSDLLRYFEISEKNNVEIFIFWVVLNRPCVLGNERAQFYYRLASELKPIWEKENVKRKFRRQSGLGDTVEGKHLGVTVNYHFSLNELIKWNGNLNLKI